MPKISVVMASYQHAAFVAEAVTSALTQTGPELELVITDDGSRDGTPDVIRRMTDPRIRLEVFPENRGACVAANDAITRARGEYIAVLNSDDFFLPGKLARQAEFLDAHPEVGAVFGLPRFVDERGAPFVNPSHAFTRLYTSENRPRHAWLRHFFYERNCLCHPTVMLRRECYARAGLFDPLLMQLPDLDFWVRLCAAFEIHILPEPLTAFRILDREKNVSTPAPDRLARAAWEMAQVLERYAALPAAELVAIFAGETPVAGGADPQVGLALRAIRVGKPGYAAFGLNLLRRRLREAPGSFPVTEYFRLVGTADPLAAEFYSRDHQLLKRSRLAAAARSIVRRLRSRNWHG